MKYETNDEYRMINISLLPASLIPRQSRVTYDMVLKTYLPFDEDEYNRIKDTEDYSYYINLIRRGLQQANEFSPIPLHELNVIIDDFVRGGCRNEWIYKKKRFKDDDLQLILKCEFTRRYFQLRLIANSICKKQEIANGILMRCEPDEVLFEGMYRDIIISDDSIFVTDRSDRPRYVINKSKLLKGEFESKIIGDEWYQKTFTYLMDEKAQNRRQL